MKYIIETKDISFSFKKKCVLNNINLKIPQGSIYGYLGKNGSGKSTTIRILLGLLRPQSGVVLFFENNLISNRSNILCNVGHLIESPSFYPNLTTYENLKYIDLVLGCGENRINEILSLVNLTDVRNKKINKLSSGMKQRIGIALALLHDPDILVLDEPLNGLDPEGVHDMRQLIISLQREGKTIFLSSHILCELEKVCTHIGILHNGQLVYQGKLDEFINSDGSTLESTYLSLTSNIKI